MKNFLSVKEYLALEKTHYLQIKIYLSNIKFKFTINILIRENLDGYQSLQDIKCI